MKFGKMTKGKLALGVGAVVFALLIPLLCGLFGSGVYLLNVINYIFVYIIASTGLNVMTGYSGQINLGGAAYFSVGAYGVVILCNAGVPTIFSVILAMLIVALFGFLTAIPAAKLKFHFLALATMAVGEIVNNLLVVSPGGIIIGLVETAFGYIYSPYQMAFTNALFLVFLLLLPRGIMNEKALEEG